MTLGNALRVRLVLTVVLSGLVGVATVAYSAVKIQELALFSVFERAWENGRKEATIAACLSDPEHFAQEDSDGVRIFAYDEQGMSRNPAAPSLDPSWLEARDPESRGRVYLGDGPLGGEFLLSGGEGPCARFLGQWPVRAEMRLKVRRQAALGLGAMLLFTLALTYFLLLRPVGQNILSLRDRVRRIGDVGHTPPPVTGRSEFDDIARGMDAAHERVMGDRETILRHRDAMERFLTEVAHDLRTPITSLRLSLEALGENELDEEARRSLESAVCDAVYIGSLTTNLRMANRLQDGWDPLQDNPSLDLGDVVARVRARERVFAKHRRMHLEAATPERTVHVRGDATMVEQALTNIVQNALNYGESGGHVAVVLATEGDSFRLTVDDDGPGVLPEELPRLGEATFRSDAARARDPRGSGLGLAITRSICERLEWELCFEARTPQGLRVQICGPLLEVETVHDS